MKVGDLVKFKKEHWDRPGYAYCANWYGLIWRYTDPDFEIYWVTPMHGNLFGDVWALGDNTLEVINEAR